MRKSSSPLFHSCISCSFIFACFAFHFFYSSLFNLSFSFDEINGLARLLLLERLTTPAARTQYKNQQHLKTIRFVPKNIAIFRRDKKSKRWHSTANLLIFLKLYNRPLYEKRGSFWDDLNDRIYDDYTRDRESDSSSCACIQIPYLSPLLVLFHSSFTKFFVLAADYSLVFLPWGPRWNARKVRKIMFKKDLVLNSRWYDPKKKFHTHPCFFGTVSFCSFLFKLFPFSL